MKFEFNPDGSIKVPERFIRKKQINQQFFRESRLEAPEKLETYMDSNFSHLLNLIKTSKNSLFITGKAGTGKSTLLKIFVQKTENVVVLAPTGLAASNIKGQTIHSFFRLKPGLVSEEDIEESCLNETVKLNCLNMDYLVIDEISMVRADMFDAINIILQNTRNSDAPFGGVKLILFGDLYQLPPIVHFKERNILSKNYGYKVFYFFGSKVFNKINLEIENLTKVYRQKDLYFIQLLDKVRKGKITQKDLEVFQSKTIDSVNRLAYPPVILTTTNDNVKVYNSNRLKEIPTQSKLYKAEILSGNFSKKELPVEDLVEIKIGARVMIIRNKENTYVNGDLGTVTSYDEKSVTVKLDRNGKEEVIHQYTWENFSYRYDQKIKKIRKWVSGMIKQIPLKLAWAMTVHKSQGLTLNNIYIDTTSGIWSPGQLYVALSRCPSLKGLHLKTVPEPNQFMVDPIVENFFANQA